MKKILRICVFIFIIFCIISIVNINKTSAAIAPGDYKPSDLNETVSAVQFGNKIIGAFQAIGSIVSVFALVLIGIKYMTSSIEEKAEYKQTMIYYIIGAVLVFAISNISAMLYNFAKTLW